MKVGRVYVAGALRPWQVRLDPEAEHRKREAEAGRYVPRRSPPVK